MGRKAIVRQGILGAGQSVVPVNVHRAGPTDALTARAAIGEGWILFIFYLIQGVQHHGSAFANVNFIGLHDRLLRRVIWVLGEIRVSILYSHFPYI